MSIRSDVQRRAPRALAALIAFLALCAASASAVAGDFVDTRISFIFSDDNALAGPGETLINSPQADFGPRDGLFFPFENLNSKDDGDETLTHLVVYKEMPGFFTGLTTDAALVGRLAVLAEPETNFRSGAIDLSDGGSYLRARYALDGSAGVDEQGKTKDAKRQLEITFFPMNSDRFVAGYTYDISWGGNKIYTDRKSAFATPGFRVRFDLDGFYALAGAKTTRQLILEPDPNNLANRELGSFWGGLFGLGYIQEMFGIEVNGGVFDAGRIPKQGIQGKKVTSGGVSTRISFFTGGLKPAQSIDYKTYTNDSEALLQTDYFLRKPKNYEDFAIRAQLEGSSLFQTLDDFDKPLSTTTVRALAGAIRVDAFYERWAFNVDAVYRDLSFILFNVPSLDPFLSFPKDSEQAPEMILATKAEYWIESLNLIPSVLFGVQFPAAYRGRISQTTNPSDLTSAEQTVVVPESGTIIPFPDGSEPLPVFSARLTLRWDLSDMMSFIGQTSYTYDRNQLGRTRDQTTQTAKYEFRDPNVLGFTIFAQARF